MDLGILKWTNFASDPEIFAEMPSPREYSAIVYDQRDRRLVIHGGWNNGWFDDIRTLGVSKIVGPSYAVTHADPALGQLSGNVPITLTGLGIKDVAI